MSALVLLAVAGITVVWSLERILRKRIRYTASYEVTAVIDAGYLARSTERASLAPADVEEVREEPVPADVLFTPTLIRDQRVPPARHGLRSPPG